MDPPQGTLHLLQGPPHIILTTKVSRHVRTRNSPASQMTCVRRREFGTIFMIPMAPVMRASSSEVHVLGLRVEGFVTLGLTALRCFWVCGCMRSTLNLVSAWFEGLIGLRLHPLSAPCIPNYCPILCQNCSSEAWIGPAMGGLHVGSWSGNCPDVHESICKASPARHKASPDKPGLRQGSKLEEQVKSRWACVQEWDYRLFTYVALAHEE